jgi:hypothetical protein
MSRALRLTTRDAARLGVAVRKRKPTPLRLLPAEWHTELGSARFVVPIRVVSEKNQHEHWSDKARRTAAQRRAVWLITSRYTQELRSLLPCTVTLTRIVPSANKLIRDRDNLYRAMSAVRDQIAEVLGVDDADLREDAPVRWGEYGQDQGAGWGVRIEVRKA